MGSRMKLNKDSKIMKFILSVHVLLRACRRWCSKKSPVVLTVSSMDWLTTIKNQGTIASVRGKKEKEKKKAVVFIYFTPSECPIS